MTQVYPDHVEQAYEHTHVHRYEVSLNRIKKRCPNPKVIVDVGGESPFTHRLKALWPDAEVIQVIDDVRELKTWAAIGNEEADLVLCMEVMEHLGDHDGIYYGRGVGVCLDECRRVLKKGGIFFLTTPNLNSICCLLKLLAHEDVANWAYHPHELGFKTVVNTVAKAGFEVIESGTEEPYMHLKPPNYPSLHELMSRTISQLGFHQDNRGEMTVVIARKR